MKSVRFGLPCTMNKASATGPDQDISSEQSSFLGRRLARSTLVNYTWRHYDNSWCYHTGDCLSWPRSSNSVHRRSGYYWHRQWHEHFNYSYLSDRISRTSNCGLLICIEGVTISFGTLNACWIDFGSFYCPDNLTWRFPIVFQIVFDLLIIFEMLFLPESPRWLLTCERYEAMKGLLLS